MRTDLRTLARTYLDTVSAKLASLPVTFDVALCHATQASALSQSGHDNNIDYLCAAYYAEYMDYHILPSQ